MQIKVGFNGTGKKKGRAQFQQRSFRLGAAV